MVISGGGDDPKAVAEFTLAEVERLIVACRSAGLEDLVIRLENVRTVGRQELETLKADSMPTDTWES